MRASVVVLVVAVALAVVLAVTAVEAHKSVKYHKPATEEAREEHHQMMRKQPDWEAERGDEHFMRNQKDEFSTLDHSHKSHHKRWGPQYPDHTKHINFHYRPPRFVKGSRVPENIHVDDYHLFGLSRNEHM